MSCVTSQFTLQPLSHRDMFKHRTQRQACISRHTLTARECCLKVHSRWFDRVVGFDVAKPCAFMAWLVEMSTIMSI